MARELELRLDRLLSPRLAGKKPPQRHVKERRLPRGRPATHSRSVQGTRTRHKRSSDSSSEFHGVPGQLGRREALLTARKAPMTVASTYAMKTRNSRISRPHPGPLPHAAPELALVDMCDGSTGQSARRHQRNACPERGVWCARVFWVLDSMPQASARSSHDEVQAREEQVGSYEHSTAL